MAPRWFKKTKNDYEEEVMSILEDSSENGSLREEGKKMINAIFAFDDKLAHEIMTPRTDVFMIDIQDPQEEYMEQLLDNTPGSATVLGLMNDTENRVQLVIDKDVLRHEYLGCHPCINTSSLRLRLTDVLETLLPAMHHSPILVELPWEQEAPCTNP